MDCGSVAVDTTIIRVVLWNICLIGFMRSGVDALVGLTETPWRRNPAADASAWSSDTLETHYSHRLEPLVVKARCWIA